MDITFITSRKAPASSSVVAYGVTAEGFEDPSCRTELTADLETLNFAAKVGQIQLLPQGKQVTAIVGLGPEDQLDANALRIAAAALARTTSQYKTISCDLPHVSGLPINEATRAVVEGIGLASYQFGYKTKKTDNENQNRF